MYVSGLGATDSGRAITAARAAWLVAQGMPRQHRASEESRAAWQESHAVTPAPYQGSAVTTKTWAGTYYGTPEQHREFMQALQGGQAALNAWAAKYTNAPAVFRAQKKFSNLVPQGLELSGINITSYSPSIGAAMIKAIERVKAARAARHQR